MNAESNSPETNGKGWLAHGAFYDIEGFDGESSTSPPPAIVNIFSPDRTRFQFEKARSSPADETHYRIKRISRPHGDWQLNALTYSYYKDTDFLEAVTDPYGKKIYFFYDDKGFLIAILFKEYIVQYQYNEKEHTLISVRIPRVAIAPSDVGSAETIDITSNYQYEPNDQYAIEDSGNEKPISSI